MAPGPVAVSNLTSERGQAAVNDQRGSSDVASGWAGKEDDGSRELLRVTGPARRQARQLAVDVPIGELLCHLRWEVAGREGYHANALASGPLDGEVTRQPNQAGLTRRIGRLRKPAARERGDTGDVDDRAAGLHDATAGLSHPIAAIQVDVDHLA